MEQDFKDKYVFKKNKNKGVGFALFLILFGGIYLLLNLNIIPSIYRPLLISWQTLLIVIGIWSLLKGQYAGGTILIVIGSIFIYPVLCRIFPDIFTDLNIDFWTYWPVLLIIVGIVLIFKHRFPSQKKHNKFKTHHEDYATEHSNSNYIKKSLLFSGAEQTFLSQNFEGGEASVMFGELIIDLRKAQLATGQNYLEANVMFGNIVILVPPHWTIDVQSNSFLGSFEDKRLNPEYNTNIDSACQLIIKGSAMFGNGEVRN